MKKKSKKESNPLKEKVQQAKKEGRRHLVLINPSEADMTNAKALGYAPRHSHTDMWGDNYYAFVV